MPNIIITEPSDNLRALGREALVGKWKTACIVVLICQICTTLPPRLLNLVFGQNILRDIFNYPFEYEGFSSFSMSYTPLSNIYVILVEGCFILGVSIFFLTLFRKQKEDISQVFAGFERFVKALGLFFMVSLFTILWSLLFFVPGIIAAYRYSQSFFILADNPDKPIMDCIYESKMMMMGNKGKLFCLHFSFIGWSILAALPGAIITSAMEFSYAPILFTQLIAFITGLLEVVVMTYIYATSAAFYDILTGRLRASTYMPGQY